MLNQIQENPFVVNAPVTTAVTSGQVVIQANVVGVAISDGAVGSTVGILLGGIVQLAADNTLTFVFGQSLYWNTSAAQLTHIASGNTFIGHAASNKGTTGTIANVILAGTLAP